MYISVFLFFACRFNRGRFGEGFDCKHRHYPFAIEF